MSKLTVPQMIRVWREDPVKWAKDVLGVELDEWQKVALVGYRKNMRSALVACKGPRQDCNIGYYCLALFRLSSAS